MIVPNEIHHIMNRVNEIDDHDSVFLRLVREGKDKEREMSQIDSNVNYVQFYTQWCPDCLHFATLREEL